jgi:hypothetical protein
VKSLGERIPGKALNDLITSSAAPGKYFASLGSILVILVNVFDLSCWIDFAFT